MKPGRIRNDRRRSRLECLEGISGSFRAGRRNKKGRAMRGMIMGIRVDIKMEKSRNVRVREGLITGKVWLGDWWKVVGIYINRDLESKLDMLKE